MVYEISCSSSITNMLAFIFLIISQKIWCRMSDLNRRPTAYKAVATTTELQGLLKLVAGDGI